MYYTLKRGDIQEKFFVKQGIVNCKYTHNTMGDFFEKNNKDGFIVNYMRTGIFGGFVWLFKVQFRY